MKFTLIPRMPIRKKLLQNGRINAPVISDMNGDGKPELIMGISTGGLLYYTGDISTIGIENDHFEYSNNKLKIYPNPGKDELWIEGMGFIQIINAQGQIILNRKKTKNLEKIDTREWPSGIYFIRLRNNHEIWIKT